MYSKDSVEKVAMQQISWEPWMYSKAAVKKRQSSMNIWAIIWAIRTLLPCSRRNMSNIYIKTLFGQNHLHLPYGKNLITCIRK